MNRSWQVGTGLVLTALAGFVDALGFVRLGGLYTSLMSGNTTQLAVAIGHGEGQHALLPFLLILAVSIALKMQRSVTALAPTHLVAFFLSALVCHGELAKDRPSVAHLTEFYLWMSVGGMLGGISTGQDLRVTLAIKPTSSIRLPRASIDRENQPTTVETHGRHDPCVGIRAAPIAEAMLALVVMDHALRQRAQCADVNLAVPAIPGAAG